MVVVVVLVVVVDLKKNGWGVQGGRRSASPRKAFAEILSDMLRLSDVDRERVGGAGGRRCKALQKFGLPIDMLRLWSLLSSLRKAFAEILNDMLRLSDVDKERVGGAGGRRCKALQKFGLLIDMLRLWSLLSSLRKAFAEILNDMLRLSDVDKERVGGAGGRRCKALQKFGLLIDMLRLWSLLSLLLLLFLWLLLLLLFLL